MSKYKIVSVDSNDSMPEKGAITSWKDADVQTLSNGIDMLLFGEITPVHVLCTVEDFAPLSNFAKLIKGVGINNYFQESIKFYDACGERMKREQDVMEIWYIAIEDTLYALTLLLELIVPLEKCLPVE